MILFLAALLLAAAGTDATAQEIRHVSGMVTTYKSLPLSKVRVTASKSKEEVLTDIDGKFVIGVQNRDILNFSAAGFKGKRLRIKGDNIYITDLTFVNTRANFESAVSNGHITEETLRQAIGSASVSGTRDYSKYKSIYELISSEFYNLRVKGNAIVNTRVRSFDSNPQVLLVVNERIVNDISYINPDYVKDIEFIDDVRSTLFGAQGANGVLKITLK